VRVDLVLDLMGKVVGCVPVTGGGDLGLLGQLVLDATADSDGVALDALEVFPAVDSLEGVADAILQLLVATGRDEVASKVGAKPVETVRGVGGLVYGLSPDFLEDLSVPNGGDTNVELVRDLHVELLLHGDLFLLVVVNIDLKTPKISC